MLKFIYHLIWILFKVSITRNYKNQAPFIAVKPMIYVKVCLVITASKLLSSRDVIANLALFTLALS